MIATEPPRRPTVHPDRRNRLGEDNTYLNNVVTYPARKPTVHPDRRDRVGVDTTYHNNVVTYPSRKSTEHPDHRDRVGEDSTYLNNMVAYPSREPTVHPDRRDQGGENTTYLNNVVPRRRNQRGDHRSRKQSYAFMQAIQPPVTTTLAAPAHGATMAAPVGAVATAPPRGSPEHLGHTDTVSSDISRAAKAPTEHTAPPGREVRAERMIAEAARGNDDNRGRSREQDYNHYSWNTRRGRDTQAEAEAA